MAASPPPPPPPPPPPRPGPKLRILCFGDSLTAGYSRAGAPRHPYGVKLEQMLAMAFPDVDFDVVVDGKRGDTVRLGFVERMRKYFPPGDAKRQEDEEKKPPFDWVIVLGGTNDLYIGVPPQEIFDRLKDVWELPLRRRCRVLGLTVPEAAAAAEAPDQERLDAQRQKLNELILGHKRDGLFGGAPHTHTKKKNKSHAFNLSAAVPYHSLSEADRKKHWAADRRHLTADGYDMAGNKVGMALVSILLAAERPANACPAKRRWRRMFKDDDRHFDEEAGDPAAIDRGYVMVRWVDLD